MADQNNTISDNKRIAKNTIYMYFRMGISMFVGLYTSRVVLNTLGVEDFGIYNVIGGIISLFAVLNAAMVNTTSRFITVCLAEGDELESRQIFSMVSLIHFIIALFVLFLGETVGIWYVKSQMIIPEGREVAALWLLQFSIITSFLSIISVPYNATIIAHEKMSAFAGIQIMDVFLKLIVVLLLTYSSIDLLIFYGFLLMLISVFDLSLYFIYCKIHFTDTKLLFYWNKLVFNKILNFAGWALVGNFSNFFYTQGINILLNYFSGPAANAARGIAVQVESIVKQFANNVQTAINPQIIKSYASNEMERMYTLIYASSKYCFYLLYLLTLPILIETDFILQFWLGQVPAHTINFIRIIMCVSLFDALINPMFTANLASGKLKVYHLTLSILMYSFMFVTFFAIKFTLVPESMFICLLIATIIGLIMRIFILEKQIGLCKKKYLSKVLLPICLVVIVSLIIPVTFHMTITHNIVRFFATCISSIFSVALSVYFLGIGLAERKYITLFVRKRILKK